MNINPLQKKRRKKDEQKLGKLEQGQVLICSFGVTVLAAILFYRSIWGMILMPLIYCFIYKRKQEKIRQQWKADMEEQFISGMRTLNTSLQAGLSMENAWKEVEQETKSVYGEKAPFFKAVQEINHSVAVNMSIERLFLEFAYKTEIEDIVSFAEIFSYGKRSGGNWKRIICSTIQRMSEKYDAKKEIAVMVAGKQMEQKVMNIIPLGILAFLQIGSWDYIQSLYHNVVGVVCMSICLGGYLFAILLSEKILRIQV